MPEKRAAAKKTAPKKAIAKRTAAKTTVAKRTAPAVPAAAQPAIPRPAATPQTASQAAMPAEICPRCGTAKFAPEQRIRVDGNRTVRYTILVCERGHTFARPRSRRQ